MQFSVGDFVDINTCDQIGNDILLFLRKKNPDILIIIESSIESSTVALCWTDKRPYTISLKAGNQEISVYANKLLTIDNSLLQKNDAYQFYNTSKAIEIIVNKNKKLKNEKEIRKAKKREIKVERLKKQRIRVVTNKYKNYEKRMKQYEYAKDMDIASINNDHKTMNEIVKKCGKDPRIAGTSPKKGIYDCNNPKPYSGGRFSGK